MMRRARGVMLIDVLASLVLLGGTVVTLLLAQSRSVERLASSRQRSTASTLASELLSTWRLARTDVRAIDEGVFPDELGWSWRRAVQHTVVADSVDATEIKLDIIHADRDGGPRIKATYRWLELPGGDTTR